VTLSAFEDYTLRAVAAATPRESSDFVALDTHQWCAVLPRGLRQNTTRLGWIVVTHRLAKVIERSQARGPWMPQAPPLGAPITTLASRRRKRPDKGHADKGDDIPRCRQDLRKRHIEVRITCKGIDSSQRVGRHPRAVERTLSWLNQFRRLRVRDERRAERSRKLLPTNSRSRCGVAPPLWQYVHTHPGPSLFY
jgi:hypothetical protein